MDVYRLPPRAQELVKCFVNFHERVTYFLAASDIESLGHIEWITQVCTPTYENIVAVVQDKAIVYTSPNFIRLLYRDNKFKDIRDRHVRLVDALESQSSQLVVEELFKHLDKFTVEDRGRGFLLLASKVDETGNKVRVEWLDRISQSFEVSPRTLRPQLLHAASIIGHEPMVTQVLQDIAADEELTPNVDAVEAECLIEATVNQHFFIVKKLLDGGRFSNGSETCWNAVVHALGVSCSNGSADITDILLPHYLSYCSVTSTCSAHHPRLLRLALSNWHFEIAEMLLDCDPRGSLCNMMELIVSLRDEVAQATQDCTDVVTQSGFAAIVLGEGNDDEADLLLWDAAALARGVSSENKTMVRFLVNHVNFCPETLRAALTTAQGHGNLEIVEIISSRLQTVDQHTTIVADNEAESGAVDEMIASSPYVNLNCSGGLYRLELVNQCRPSGMNDTQRHLTDADNDDDVVASQLLPRLQSAYNSETLRSACFSMVEHVISSARQSVILKMHDLSDAHDDKDVVTSEGLIRSRSSENLDALRTTCCSTVEHVISSARQSVLKLTEMCQNEFVANSKVEEDSEIDMADDSLEELQHPIDMYPVATLALLHEFSSTTVDQIIDEGKLAVAQHKVDTPTPTDEMMQNSTMTNNSEENATFQYDQRTVETRIPMKLIDCEQSTTILTTEDEDENQMVIDKFAVLDGVSSDSLSNSQDWGTISELPAIQSEDHTDALSSDELNSGHSDPAVIDNKISDAEASENDTSADLKKDKTSPPLEPPLRSIILQQELPGVEDDTTGIVARIGKFEDASIMVQAPSVFDPEITVTAEPHENICSIKATVVHPCKSAAKTNHPTVSPDRATIICPVKWVENTMDAPGTVFDISARLSEGDRVELRYKGRNALLPGIIIFCHSNNAYDVAYEDGGEDVCVPRKFIQLVDTSNTTPSCDLQKVKPETGEHHSLIENHLSASECSLLDANGEDNERRNSTSTSCTSVAYQPDQQQWMDDAEVVNDIRLSTNEVLNGSKNMLNQLSDTTWSTPSLTRPNSEECLIQAPNTPPFDMPNNYLDVRNITTCSTLNSTRVSSRSSHEELRPALGQALVDNSLTIEHLPEIPSVFVLNTELSGSRTRETADELQLTTETSQRRLRDRQLSVASQQSRCTTADNASAEELAEWRNVDLLLNRKRRFFQTQTGSIESAKVPWGEEFATIQSLKRFAAQYPDILRAHIETQLRELDGALLSNSPGKIRSSKKTNVSAHSGAAQARESLLLMKDLAFLLQHRLAPFFDSIIPVVLETVFSAEKRFLCETATEVLDAIILHCSGRKLALVFLQLNEMYSKYQDLSLYNLTSVYVEKCVHNWNKPECSSLLYSSQLSTTLLRLLATMLISKSAPGRIAAQKSFQYLRDELGARNFETVLRAHLTHDLQHLVIKEHQGLSKSSRTRNSSKRCEAEKQVDTRSPTIVQTSPSILQRMLLHRQNRVLPKQT